MDKDLQSVQEARDLLEKAHLAQLKLNHFSQNQVDEICAAMAEAGFAQAERLAQLAVEESGLGRVDSKKIKNEFCTRDLWEAMKDLKTVGVIARDHQRMVYDIAEPMGVVAAIIPTTNPTSTAIFKIMIALKSRNAIVISPHPRSIECTRESARVLYEAALRAGAPEGFVGCLQTVTLDGANELMRHKRTSVILSTGGEAIVHAAYSSGKPAYGVGPGNAPAYIHKSADVRHAVQCLITSKLFDYGTVCASEQSVIVDESVAEEVRAELRRQKAYFVSVEEKKKVEAVSIHGSIMNPSVVGQSACRIATLAGFEVPEDTSLLMVEMQTVGPQEPCSREILAPVLGMYVEQDWKSACERCLEVLRFGGMGHTFVVHARDPQIIMEFALKKPAYRFLVNTPSTLGSIGSSTGLFPSMSLGCGSSGGNISADNIGPMNLLNIKRLAFDRMGDEWASQMKVDETLVSEFVPFQKSTSKATPTPAEPAEETASAALVYNGRRREVRTL